MPYVTECSVLFFFFPTMLSSPCLTKYESIVFVFLVRFHRLSGCLCAEFCSCSLASMHPVGSLVLWCDIVRVRGCLGWLMGWVEGGSLHCGSYTSIIGISSGVPKTKKTFLSCRVFLVYSWYGGSQSPFSSLCGV